MSWTTEYPTKPGFYWIRNYTLKLWRGDVTIPGPTIADIQGEQFDLIADDRGYSKREIVRAEWQGPIKPDEQKPRPRVYHDLFPEIVCATCLERSTKFISWPIAETDGKVTFGFICYECWINSLTPEQRKVYMV